MLNIVTCKWKAFKDQKISIPNQAVTTYNHEHVNIQYDMIARHLKVPFRFILFTDEMDAKINPVIEQKPFWDEFMDLGGCYPRLRFFKEEMKEIIGERFIHIDLSTIITGDITDIFTRDEDFVALKIPDDVNKKLRMAGSFYIMKSGTRSEVYHDFKKNPEKAIEISRKKNYGTDQSWMCHALDWENESFVDDTNGIFNFRMHGLKDYKGETLPPFARMIFFTGPRDPSHPEIWNEYPWLQKHYRLNTDEENKAIADKYKKKLEVNLPVFKLKDKDENGETLNLIHIAKSDRRHIYNVGIKTRVNKLAAVYFFDKINIKNDDVIVDVGANIGELGIYLKSLNKNIRYIPVEPSVAEANCCDLNYGDKVTINKGLWYEATTLKFYNKNETADSSLIPLQNYTNISKIEVVTLASLMNELNIKRVKILKINAEGAEPEVLRGAEAVLDIFDHIVVDCGPERGYKKETTWRDVINFLVARGFHLNELDTSVRRVCHFMHAKRHALKL